MASLAAYEAHASSSRISSSSAVVALAAQYDSQNINDRSCGDTTVCTAFYCRYKNVITVYT